jgi:hypothetical protein
MAKSFHHDAMDEFVLSRWPEVRDLAAAFRGTSIKMRRRLKRAVRQLDPTFQEKGFALYTELTWAEIKAYRPAWGTSQDEPLATLAIGAFYPVGYMQVKEPRAYAGIYLEEFDESRPDTMLRLRDDFYRELGGKPSDWEDRTEDANWNCMLWAPLEGVDENRKAALARDASELRRFAQAEFERLFAFADPLDRAIRRHLQSVA